MKLLSFELPYYNEKHNVKIVVEDFDDVVPNLNREIATGDGDGGIFKWGINEEDGIVKFGIWYEDVKKRPGNGGLWSSSESTAYDLIGLELVDIAINSTSASITVGALEKILPSGFNIKRIQRSHSTVFEVVAS